MHDMKKTQRIRKVISEVHASGLQTHLGTEEASEDPGWSLHIKPWPLWALLALQVILIHKAWGALM